MSVSARPARGLVSALWLASLALCSYPTVAHGSWARGRDNPSARDIAAVDATGEPRWPWGIEDISGDGAGTYMLRIRITAGELTTPQAKAVAHVAYRWGYGIVDVTTRANLQVQGLQIADVPAALAALEAVGLTAKQTGHDNVRNVFGHPLAGLDAAELIDTRELCRQVTALFLDDRPDNITAARDLGIHGLLFTTPESAHAEIDGRYSIPRLLKSASQEGALGLPAGV